MPRFRRARRPCVNAFIIPMLRVAVFGRVDAFRTSCYVSNSSFTAARCLFASPTPTIATPNNAEICHLSSLNVRVSG